MAEEDGLSGAERELESALKSVPPIEVAVDPIQAAYVAGRRSQQRAVRIWQGGTLAATAAACVFAWLPIGQFRSKSNAVVPGHSVAVQNRGATAAAAVDQETAMTEQAVLDHGLDGLSPLRLPDFSSADSSGAF